MEELIKTQCLNDNVVKKNWQFSWLLASGSRVVKIYFRVWSCAIRHQVRDPGTFWELAANNRWPNTSINQNLFSQWNKDLTKLVFKYFCSLNVLIFAQFSHFSVWRWQKVKDFAHVAFDPSVEDGFMRQLMEKADLYKPPLLHCGIYSASTLDLHNVSMMRSQPPLTAACLLQRTLEAQSASVVRLVAAHLSHRNTRRDVALHQHDSLPTLT